MQIGRYTIRFKKINIITRKEGQTSNNKKKAQKQILNVGIDINRWELSVICGTMAASTVVQWKPLNVITLGQNKSDNINWMITLTDDFYLVIYSKWDFEMWSH